MTEKKYMIDNDPASARDIILMAKEYDCGFGSDGFCQTSVAAFILRQYGHTVEENPNYKA